MCIDDTDALGHALGTMAVELVKVGQESVEDQYAKRLAAVQELVRFMKRQGLAQYSLFLLEDLAAVWPEAVEE